MLKTVYPWTTGIFERYFCSNSYQTTLWLDKRQFHIRPMPEQWNETVDSDVYTNLIKDFIALIQEDEQCAWFQ